ncbi:squalene cyclase [Microbacterium sp.]|uniref:squalene cyclase n=1 Tax=Microbacterium sp. TaxID=51671 RepID=UPI002E334984|nr:squalene cyclase [Microbacterium sp.]HEX5728093.1 squalene cyclase [Microbacterium sp.]
MTSPTPDHLLAWLLDSDPALRWQVERDLAGAAPSVWQATRARVATEGIGARLLALQAPDGQWAGGAYFPAPPANGAEIEEAGQPWTATTWCLNSLREWGVGPKALEGTAERLATNSRWEYEDLPYWGGEVDACINGYTLANGGWLGADVSGLAAWFVDHQMTEGGWNCDWIDGVTRASFHSTLNALRGILVYERTVGVFPDLREARRAGEEYLLARRLTRRLSTGEPVGSWVTRFAYPFRWRYDALKAVDYFREAALHDGMPPDPRIRSAIELVRGARREDGTWLQGERDRGRVWFEVDVPEGQPSKWLTFYGTRALDWWDSQAPAGAA